MQVKVLFFGPAKDVTGLPYQWYEIQPDMTLKDIIRRLYEDFPDAGEVFDLCSYVINKEFAETASPLQDHDEIAVLPPVSGG